MPSDGQVPDGWRVVRLGDVAGVTMGQSPPGAMVLDWDGNTCDAEGLPFIQGNAEFGAKFPTPLKWCIRPLKVAEPDDILISVRAPVGQTNRSRETIGIGRGLAAIRFAEFPKNFGWHVINHAKEALERVTQGSTFQAIGGEQLRNLRVPSPPLLEQRAIAGVLDAIDEAIERTEAVIGATERLRDSLLHELLTRGVPGWHTEWKEVAGVGTVPACWEVVRLGEVADLNRCHWDPTESSSILYLDLTAVVAPGRLSRPSEVAAEDAPSRARRRARSGDVLVSTVRPYLRGFARIHEAPENLVASTGFAVLSPRAFVNGSFIYHQVMARRFTRYLENAMTGQAYPAVRPGDIASYVLPLPTVQEQRAIAGALDAIDEAIESGSAERDRLTVMKASASDALLTGRLRVL